ncbi:LysR family transcriptional regulator [Azospirillum rugosum]|uniref:DNA-binding transcriptional LysR family regulator n=1 Tax=Azospirillum rugosum TaxID=416170 RepID=A0ABS4SMI9_9PROT|nr:LysR family transcriptional regulator [Azospirillum rugosum]MBP2293778.1 DNA-binding transcriptional LysR family regulator [Azospirillum rugosum]MDQ0527323.1 DNA-binding transcriptional LysR family regulator [Azospirillum rugosum]
MDHASLAVLIEAAHAGSLAAAARRLGISPLMATRRLAALEADVGARLMQRTTRSLALTPEGEAFLPYAQAMLENEAAARASVRPSSAGASGLLRLTASAAFGRKVVAPLVGEFLRANPQVSVDLLITDTQVDIVGQGIDLAIRIAPLKDSGLIARRVAPNPRALYATPSYLEEHGTPGAVADLGGHQCLTLTGTTHWSFQAGGRSQRVRVQGRFSANSIEGLREICLSGAGIAILSGWDVRDEVAAGRLVPIELSDGELEPLAIWAVHPSSRFVPPKVRLFVDALERALR